MSGNYPDVPEHRMAYDRDGSVGVWVNAADNVLTSLTNAQMRILNDESDNGYAPQGPAGKLCIIFPQLRDLSAYFVAYYQDIGFGAGELDTSADTTNGFDGTWTTRVSPWINGGGSTGVDRPYYRTAIQTLSVGGIIAVRLRVSGGFSNGWHGLHLYGKPTAGQTRYLAFWDPSSDVEVGGAYFDWADVPQGQSAVKSFRIKNLHSSLTANSILLSEEALTDTSPSVPGTFGFSTSSGGPFTSTLNIGALAAGAISSVVYIQKATPANAVLSLWASRALAVAGSWT